MIGLHDASSCLTLLVLLTGASFFHTSTTNPIAVPGDVPIPHKDTPTGLMTSSAGDGQRKDVGRQSIKKGEPEEEEEEELFKDVDPKMLAAVLLGALNSTQAERRREREQRGSMEEEGEEDAMKAELEEVREAEAYRQVRRTMEGEDRDRDGRQELELLMATQGRDRERQEEEERKKAQEEEEKMTEKVTSRTTSQTVQVQQTPEQQPPANQDRRGDDQQQRPNEQDGMEEEEEEEEQLSPEELRSLETMMKEFPRLNTATKREGDSEEQQRRESRGSASSYNDIIPTGKGGDLKKKLKWQEETQKGWNFPSFRGGNFMDDFAVGSNNAGSNAAAAAAQSQVVPANEAEDEDEEEEEEEEVLSPEQEEAQAKAEQEEMRRQAAEAQKAKMEEEKLADIASDMLLRYMVKQTSGNKKKYGSYNNNNNAAEDKRSDEEQEAAMSDQDDIDPQTIDKLIEISSKLHLPADDVVDIINDVEKKKKKDVAPEMMSHWQQQQQPLTQQTSPSFSSTANKGFSPSRVISTNQNGFPVSNDKPSAATVNLLKTWFQEKSSPPQTTRPQFDLWSKPAKPLQRTNPNPWPIRPQKPLSMQKDFWLKSPKSAWSGYPYKYPSYYQRKPYYPDFYPNTRPNPRYYIHKPALALNNFLENSADDANAFPPRRRYHSWVQPRLRKPPVGRQQSPYYASYPLPLYPGTYQPYHIPKSRSPPRLPMPMPPQRKQFYYSAGAAPALQRNDGYYAGRQPDSSGNNRDTLEKYIQRILQSPRRFE